MMNRKITCFLAPGTLEDIRLTAGNLRQSELTGDIYLPGVRKTAELPEGVISIPDVGSFMASASVREICRLANTDFVLIYTSAMPLRLGAGALERMVQVAESTGAGMVYADHHVLKAGKQVAGPLNDYQEGSLRDDFDFGSAMLYRTRAIKEAATHMSSSYHFAGFYDLRLKVSQHYRLIHIPEFLYTKVEPDNRRSGEKMFDYVDPKNREVQVEMERVCTDHLKQIDGWLRPVFRTISFDESGFSCEASVIIPVKNRKKTIRDAIASVLSQQAVFSFNLVVVDNHSTDGTTGIIQSFAERDKRLIHIIPERDDLGIGGCWNEAVFHPACGKFCIQLDSDDIYIDNTVVQQIVGAFYAQQCAMLIGAYRMVNFNLEEIPPGVIDHREWTPDNGRNNAMRINGLGAPRAFYTPVIRDIRFPNVSYGEDYAVGLNISRYYQIGRIYEPLYLCRRWEDNSDAALDIQRLNAYNHYKDKIRTIELLARQHYVSEGQPVS
jgi:hypothetical protein